MKHFTLALMAAATLCTQAVAQTTRNIYTSGTTMNLELLKTVSPSQNVQVNRTLMAGYNTICLPVSMTAEELQQSAKDIQIEKFAAIQQEGSALNLVFLDCTKQGLQAGVPYLVFSPTTQLMKVRCSAESNIDTEIKDVTLNDGKGNQVTFTSSWESQRIEGRYGIPAQQEAYILESILIRTDADKTFLPTRCGFSWDSQTPTASELEIKHVTRLDNEATSITQLEANGTPVDVYTTAGTLVKKNISIANARKALPAGIYVIGGEKIAIK